MSFFCPYRMCYGEWHFRGINWHRVKSYRTRNMHGIAVGLLLCPVRYLLKNSLRKKLRDYNHIVLQSCALFGCISTIHELENGSEFYRGFSSSKFHFCAIPFAMHFNTALSVLQSCTHIYGEWEGFYTCRRW